MKKLNIYRKVIRKFRSIFPKKYLSKYIKNLISNEINLTDTKNNFFFGYHDRTPFHPSKELILSHRKKNNSNNLDVGYFNILYPDKFNLIYSTEAFSRQQGSMLKWDKYNSEFDINFNIIENGKPINISMSIDTKDRTSEIEMPVYCFSKDDQFALSCDFFHLAKMRPGYGIEDFKPQDIIDPYNGGIWLTDRRNNTTTLIVSYEEIFKIIPKEYHDSSYLNHLSFSPDSSYIVWFLISERGKARKIFFQGKRFSNNGSVFNIENKNLSSHFCWIDDEKILSINRDDNLDWLYSIYSLDDLSKKNLRFNIGFDGHPMFDNFYEHTIIDSTPDSHRNQHLIILSKDFKRSYELGKWRTPTQFNGPERLDLHPRWDHSGLKVSIDVPDNGRKVQKILYLDKNIINKI